MDATTDSPSPGSLSGHGIWLRIPIFWRFQLGGWLAFVAFTFPLKVDLIGSTGGALLLCLIRDGSSFLLTLVLWTLYRKFWSEKGWQMALLIVGACSGAQVLQNGLFFLLRDTFPLDGEIFHSRILAFSLFYERFSLLYGWSFLYVGIREFIKCTEKRKQLALLEIQMLRAQMNPHFLYNALNALQADAGKSPEHLRQIIQAMAEYLRYSLETRNKDFIPLGKELDAMGHYLTVEQDRFCNELEFDCRIDESTRSSLVPGIVIQPLVENAIKYGRMTSPKPVTVRIATSLPESSCLRIEVSNTGHWVEQAHRRPEGGIGLENLRRRLELLYPVPPKFCIQKPEGWVVVQLDLPIKP